MTFSTFLLSLFLTLGGIVYASDVQDKININTADVKAIAEALTGIGKKRASAIVAYREAYGPFTSIDDLVNVEGISQTFIDKHADELTEQLVIE